VNATAWQGIEEQLKRQAEENPTLRRRQRILTDKIPAR
jgi:hypothetical protein